MEMLRGHMQRKVLDRLGHDGCQFSWLHPVHTESEPLRIGYGEKCNFDRRRYVQKGRRVSICFKRCLAARRISPGGAVGGFDGVCFQRPPAVLETTGHRFDWRPASDMSRMRRMQRV